MKLLSFSTPFEGDFIHIGACLSDRQIVVNLAAAWDWYAALSGHAMPGRFPDSMLALIASGETVWTEINHILTALQASQTTAPKSPQGLRVYYPLDEVKLHAPLPRPPSLRDFYAFEQHVLAAFSNRGRDVPPEWYRAPVFYFSNPNAILGPGDTLSYPAYSQELDYELEIACIIARHGRNIPASQAEHYIFGYTLLNDWSARDEQRWEMRVGLGPAKGKDFASSLGPWIVTPDELSAHQDGRPGVYDLAMRARVNGKERSRGNWNTLHYSFGEMIERASAEVWLQPGDVLGSGTVGTGCLLETTRGRGPWLQPGDLVELEAEGLGVLANKIV
jgi:fumarylacetoacetate (FAA) hydrolase